MTAAVRMVSVEPLPGYRLRLVLSDGRIVERDLSHLVPGPDASPTNVFLPWRDPAYFAQVVLPAEPWPTATWPNGVDLDPDGLIWGVDADGQLLSPAAHGEEHAAARKAR
jgi:hypothetical protein